MVTIVKISSFWVKFDPLEKQDYYTKEMETGVVSNDR